MACSTLHSIETPYPILALVGPLGSANKELAMKLAEDFHEFFAYGEQHSTVFYFLVEFG